MMEFLEFCWANAWRVIILLFIGASFGGILCYIIASIFADGRIADILRDLHNPVNVSRRIERKKQ